MAAYKLKVLNGAIAETGDKIILRGVIDVFTLHDIKADAYQREAGTMSQLKSLCDAIKAGNQLPDIEIGVRGGDYTIRDGIHYINSGCYVIDGLQRLSAAKRVLQENPQAKIHLGATLYFETDQKWEKDRFKVLNRDRRRVSPNIMLRNDADVCISVAALLKMSSNDDAFVLKGRVSWGQSMTRVELVSALSVLKTVGALHNHFGPGMASGIDELMRAGDKTMEIVGLNKWRENVRTFFDVLDQAFGVRSIAYRDLAVCIRLSFMRTLAIVFMEHSNFWEGTRLVVTNKDVEKLRKFPIGDPGVVYLIKGASASVSPILYQKIVDHLDSGRRTNRMVKWSGAKADGVLSLGLTTKEDESSEQGEALES
jgi:hypothetical protein